jgi:hypothetical protein
MGLYEFDVDRAIAIARDGRQPVELDEESVRASVENSTIYECHLPHVAMDIPGVIVHVRYQTDDGETLLGHVLIDGNHRAVRCLREGRPFVAYLLNEEESEEVLIRGAEDPFPPTKAAPEQTELGYSIRHPKTGKVRELSEDEHFLLTQFDGRSTSRDIQAAFQKRFGQPLPREELNTFAMWAQSRGYLEFSADLARSAAR